MRRRGKLRVALVLLAGLVLVVAALAVSYPFWIGPAAKPLVRKMGLDYRNLERLAGGRFAMNEVSYSNAVVFATASRVEGFLPHVWVRNRGSTNGAFLNVNGWKVRLHGQHTELGDQGERARGRVDVAEAFDEFEEALETAKKWLPRATLLNGAVVIGQREHTFSVITWEGGVLTADGVWPENATPLEIKGRFAEQPYQLSFAMHPLDLRVRLRGFETNGAVALNLSAFYKESRADAEAEFVESRSAPVRAWLKAPELKLPGKILGLAAYAEVQGSATAAWSSNRMTIAISGTAQPGAEEGGPTEPASFALKAEGDGAGARIETLSSQLKGLSANLSAPVEVGRSGIVASGSATLIWNVDAGLFMGGKTKGNLEGKLWLEPGSQIPLWPD